MNRMQRQLLPILLAEEGLDPAERKWNSRSTTFTTPWKWLGREGPSQMPSSTAEVVGGRGEIGEDGLLLRREERIATRFEPGGRGPASSWRG
jgi:hypothetical protein